MSSQSIKKTTVEIDVQGLSAAHVRQIKSLNHIIAHILKATEEGEFFDNSAELMRLCAALIQQSRFCKENDQSIPYADQVIEYSMDILQEHVSSARVIAYDN